MNISANPTKNYKSGDIIIKQGDVGDCAYIIEDGLVEILLEKKDGTVERIGTRGKGTIIGEMAIVDQEPRVATVVALQDCKLLEISLKDFERRVENADPVLQVVTQVILTRYRDTLTRIESLKESEDVEAAEIVEREQLGKSSAVENVKMVKDLEKAIGTDQISLHYQPIISLETKKIKGFEALMRWTHPEKGPISPGVFIPIAEETGLIVEASRWALRESCKALRRINGGVGFDKDLFMSVNFSSADFAEENFLEHLYQILSETDTPPQKIHLEITERLLMHQPEEAKETLEMCKKAGLAISIDDFGTGYSSLSYLHAYPIDVLKIDQSFIRNMEKDENAKELVKSVVSLAQNMNMKTIAEGVEYAQEIKTLNDMGVDQAQGYYFARPMPEKDVIDLLSKKDMT